MKTIKKTIIVNLSLLMLALTVMLPIAQGEDIHAASANAGIQYQANGQSYGWKRKAVKDGKTAGQNKKRLEAIKIKKTGKVSGNVRYQAYVSGTGWQKTKQNYAVAGTTGKSKKVGAIKVWLTGNMQKQYHVVYRTKLKGKSWGKWVQDKKQSGSAKASAQIEQIQIKLVRKAGLVKNPATGKINFYEKNKPVKNRWITTNKKTYYFNKNGNAISGWMNKDGKTYYFDTKTSVMRTGWQTINKQQFLFRTDGSAIKGWHKTSGGVYYFLYGKNAADYGRAGRMQKNTWATNSGKVFYFGANGLAYTGTKKVGNKTYTFETAGDLGTIGALYEMQKKQVTTNEMTYVDDKTKPIYSTTEKDMSKPIMVDDLDKPNMVDDTTKPKYETVTEMVDDKTKPLTKTETRWVDDLDNPKYKEVPTQVPSTTEFTYTYASGYGTRCRDCNTIVESTHPKVLPEFNIGALQHDLNTGHTWMSSGNFNNIPIGKTPKMVTVMERVQDGYELKPETYEVIIGYEQKEETVQKLVGYDQKPDGTYQQKHSGDYEWKFLGYEQKENGYKVVTETVKIYPTKQP